MSECKPRINYTFWRIKSYLYNFAIHIMKSLSDRSNFRDQNIHFKTRLSAINSYICQLSNVQVFIDIALKAKYAFKQFSDVM